MGQPTSKMDLRGPQRSILWDSLAQTEPAELQWGNRPPKWISEGLRNPFWESVGPNGACGAPMGQPTSKMDL